MDIIDVMIVGCLFEMLIEGGVMVVMILNCILDDFYKDGLNW